MCKSTHKSEFCSFVAIKTGFSVFQALVTHYCLVGELFIGQVFNLATPRLPISHYYSHSHQTETATIMVAIELYAVTTVPQDQLARVPVVELIRTQTNRK